MCTTKNMSPTQQRTVAAIRQAFLALLKERPFENITVKMICTAAQVSKFTFYNYYCDKYALAEGISEDFIDGLCNAIESSEFSESGNIERSKKVYRFVTEKKDVYHSLSTLTLNGVNFSQRLLEKLQQLTQRQIRDGMKRSGFTASDEAIIFFSHMTASGELAEIEIIVNGLIPWERLTLFQQTAAINNGILLQKICKL